MRVLYKTYIQIFEYVNYSKQNRVIQSGVRTRTPDGPDRQYENNLNSKETVGYKLFLSSI